MVVLFSLVAVGWIFLCTSLSMAFAQEVGNATDNNSGDQQVLSDEEKSAGGMKNQPKNFWALLVSGGPLMIPLGLCSIIGLASTAERCISLKRDRVLPPGFVDELSEEAQKGGVEKGIEYCDEAPKETLVADILKTGLVKSDRGTEQIKVAMEEAGARTADRMKRSLRIISLVVAVAPLLGLVGTVYGMIEAFRDLATLPAGQSKSDVLAAGIYVALVTTAAGLTIAIPFLAIYHFLNNKVDQLIEGLGLAAQDFLDNFDGSGGGTIVEKESASITSEDTSDGSAADGEPVLAS